MLTVSGLAQADFKSTITQEDWSEPRSGARMIQLPAVSKAVNYWMIDRKQRNINLLHANTEAGQSWALELHDWLVALGVPSSAIKLRAQMKQQNLLQLHVVD